jgi:hypothetical protein
MTVPLPDWTTPHHEAIAGCLGRLRDGVVLVVTRRIEGGREGVRLAGVRFEKLDESWQRALADLGHWPTRFPMRALVTYDAHGAVERLTTHTLEASASRPLA